MHRHSDTNMTEGDYSCRECASYEREVRALRSKLATIRKLAAGLPPSGDPVLVARWVIDDWKEAAK